MKIIKKWGSHANPNVLQADRTAILLPPNMFIDTVQKIVERTIVNELEDISGLGIFGKGAQPFVFIIMRRKIEMEREDEITNAECNVIIESHSSTTKWSASFGGSANYLYDIIPNTSTILKGSLNMYNK